MQGEELPSFLTACSSLRNPLQGARGGEGRAALTLRILQGRKERAAPLASHWLQRPDLKESRGAGAKESQSLFYFQHPTGPAKVLIKRIIYLIAWNHPENSLS